jgi:hypothetical protein
MKILAIRDDQIVTEKPARAIDRKIEDSCGLAGVGQANCHERSILVLNGCRVKKAVSVQEQVDIAQVSHQPSGGMHITYRQAPRCVVEPIDLDCWRVFIESKKA